MLSAKLQLLLKIFYLDTLQHSVKSNLGILIQSFILNQVGIFWSRISVKKVK